MSLLPVPLHVEIENDMSPDHPTEGTNPSAGKRMTVPSLTALAILQKETYPEDNFLLGVEEIRRRLYTGFLMHDEEKKVARQKFWVSKKFDKNCVLVLSNAMVIAWSDDRQYWDYKDDKEKCFDGEMNVPVAILKEVCWLDVSGKLKTMVLSPKTTYEVAFFVKLSATSSDWRIPVSVNLCLPDGSKQERNVNLFDKPKEKWFQIPIGSFMTSPKNVGELSFQLKETENYWKRGLVIKGVLLQPLD